MADPKRTAISIWLDRMRRDPDHDFIDEFDEATEYFPTNSRNQAIFEAMELLMDVVEVWEEHDIPPQKGRGFRVIVSNTLRQKFREEVESEKSDT